MSGLMPAPMLSAPVHHLGYVVADLEQAIERWQTTLGAGPFFVEHGVRRTVIRGDANQIFEHSLAFGHCGGTAVELMQITRRGSVEVDQAMRASEPGFNHVGYAVASLDDESAALTRAGLPDILRGENAVIRLAVHDARSLCGHNIELHADSPALRSAWRRIRESAVGWDGSDPVRELPR